MPIVCAAICEPVGAKIGPSPIIIIMMMMILPMDRKARHRQKSRWSEKQRAAN